MGALVTQHQLIGSTWELRQVLPEIQVFKGKFPGISLAVQWLGFGAFTAVAQVPSLVRELRSHKPQGVAKKKK